MSLGTLTVWGSSYEAHTAWMYPVTVDSDEDDTERKGWYFFLIAEQKSKHGEYESEDGSIAESAVVFYAEDEPIPLPKMKDFTGLDFFLKDKYSPAPNGEVYFTFYTWEALNMSDVRIRFIKKVKKGYNVEITGLVYNFQNEPQPMSYTGMIEVKKGNPHN